MSHRFVALEDVLRALEQSGPLSTGALARRLRLNRLDARLVLVDAHAHGLVRTTGRGDWAITGRGREALTTELGVARHPGRAEESWWRPSPHLGRIRGFAIGSRWRELLHPRYLARRGLPLALGAIACAGGVAVASSRLEGSAPAPVLATTNANAPPHSRHTHAHVARHLVATGVIATRHHRRSALLSTTGGIRHAPTHVIVQARRSATTRCAGRHVAHAAGEQASGACSSARGIRPRSTPRGARASPRQRRLQNTGSGGSGGISATGSSAGT